MPLKAHFLNVGQGDCTIVEFPFGRVAMIDIDNLKILDRDTRAEMLQEYRESAEYLTAKATNPFRALVMEEFFLRREQERLTDPLVYYDINIGKFQDIFRFIVTHPDMDHMTGLHRLHEQESSKKILNFWHTGFDDFNLATTTDENWKNCPYDKRDWETYKKLRLGQGVIKSLVNYQGATNGFWAQDGVEIWAPTEELRKIAVEKGQANIVSLVLKISYKGRSIVLGGDATAEESWPAICSSVQVGRIDVLKASHHGRKSGYYQPAVKAMSPSLTITSVGEKEHDATDSYRRYSDHTVSLRKTGDVQITIDDNGNMFYSPAPNVEAHWKPRLETVSPLYQFTVKQL